MEDVTRQPYEVVFWLEPIADEMFGVYWVMRIDYEGDEAVEATIFCYYDGEDESMGFHTKESALRYMMLKHPEYEVQGV